ncbi:MAG: TrmH family RNA methyltransferase [Anaerolineaceae bacterium]|nr:TrmH family RNA methyltransferase [Anaerolineaceae bacterium]
MPFFEIGIFAPIHNENIGTLWRSAFQLGAAGIFVIGKWRKSQASDTAKTRLEIPFRNYLNWENFLHHRPIGTKLIGIEIGGEPLATFQHPAQGLYILGSEANGLPDYVQKKCDYIIHIEALRNASYNVAVAGSIVMYLRFLSIPGGGQ